MPIRLAQPQHDPALALGLDPGRGAAYGAIAGAALEESVTGFAFRAAGRALFDTDKPADYLSAAQANETYGITGALQFDRPISAYAAAERADIKQRELERADILSRANLGAAETIGVALAASLLDPLGDALALVPYAGVAKFSNSARSTANAASLGRRISRGAAEGAAAGIVIESVLFPLAQIEGRDYGGGDAAFNIALSAGIGSVGRVVGDSLRARSAARGVVDPDGSPDITVLPETEDLLDLPPETRQAVFEDSVGALARGDYVRAGELLELERPADPLTPELTAADSGAALPDIGSIRAAAKVDSLARFLDEDLGDVPAAARRDDPALAIARNHAALTQPDLRGERPQYELFPEGDDRVVSQSALPDSDGTPALDPELVQGLADIEAELDLMVNNGQLSADERASIDVETDTQRAAKTPELFEAAAFCLSAEGLL